MIRMIWPGRPMTKKTSQQIVTNKKTGKYMIIPSNQTSSYENAILWQIPSTAKQGLSGRLVVIVHYWMENRAGWPDLTGLMQNTADILQKAGVIQNDKEITSWGDTRIVGIDKQNPRAEITIFEDVVDLIIRG